MANEVLIKIKAQDQASVTIDRVGGRMGSVLRAGALAAGAAIVGIGASALNMASDFETGFAEVTTLFDGSRQQIDSLRSGILDLSSEMGVGATDATTALYNAISAGVAPDNAIDFLRQNTQFAVAGVTDLNTAVDLSTTVMNAWGLESGELGRVHDVLFATVRAGKTTVGELGASMFQVAPAASAAGVSIEGVGAALATLTAMGTPTAQAATGLRAAIVELGKEGTKANKAFTDVAGEGFRDFIAGGGDMVGAMEVMQRAADDQGVAISDLFGAVEGGLAVQVLAGEGFEALAANMDAAKSSTGLTQEAFEVMNETFGRQFGILTNQLKVILLEVALRILPVLTDAIQRVLPHLRTFAGSIQDLVSLAIAVFNRDAWGMHEAFNALPTSIQPAAEKLISIMRIIRDDVVPAVQMLAGHFVTGMQTILEAVRPMFAFIFDNKPIMIAALAAIGVAVVLAFGPASLAIGAILGLIIAIGYLRDNWETVADIFERFLPVFAAAGAAIAVVAAGIMGTLVPAIVAWTVAEVAKAAAMIAAGVAFLAANAPIIAIVAGIALLVAGIVLLIQHWDEITTFINTAWAATVAFLRESFAGVTSFLDEQMGFWDELIIGTMAAIVNVIRETWELIGGIVIGTMMRIADVILEKVTLAANIIRFVFTAIVGFIQENWDTISSIILGALELIKINVMDQLTFIRDIFRLAHAIFTGQWSEAWDILKGIVTDRLDFMKQRIEVVFGLIRDLFVLGWAAVRDVTIYALTAVKNFITDTFDDIVDAGRDFGTTLANAISAAFKAAWNAAAGAINAIINAIQIPGISIPFGPDIPGFDPFPHDLIPTLHRGGTVPGRPGQTVLAALEAGEHVTSADEVPAGGGYTINVYVEDRSPAAIANAVQMAAEELGERLALEGV